MQHTSNYLPLWVRRNVQRRLLHPYPDAHRHAMNHAIDNDAMRDLDHVQYRENICAACTAVVAVWHLTVILIPRRHAILTRSDLGGGRDGDEAEHGCWCILPGSRGNGRTSVRAAGAERALNR